jgi:aerobic carbon-monoxide dehydrogenase small subunit
MERKRRGIGAHLLTMISIQLSVNGRPTVEVIEPRTHLADFLRDGLNLTGTHLRCEQGVCGACTILIDGQPARACITYAVLCQGAEITTIEGLEDDPIMAALRRSFTEEHGLQCGFCTPGMLVTARDIVTRLPHADAARVRNELSGNLCRCTGYVGVVRAVCRTLNERRGDAPALSAPQLPPLGPVGSRNSQATALQGGASFGPPGRSTPLAAPGSEAVLGLGSRRPNIEMRQCFTVARPPAEVWAVLRDIEQVAPCLPGARLTQKPVDDHVRGEVTAKLGPITSAFIGEARIITDDTRQRGTILGAGRDRLSGSRAAGEVEYALCPADGASATRVDIVIRVLLAGPLAQFARSRIVEEFVARLAEAFARNLQQRLGGPVTEPAQASVQPLRAGSLLRTIFLARLKAMFARFLAGLRG